MNAYLNREDRSRILALMVVLSEFEEIEKREKLRQLFGEHWADLKRSRTFLRRALEQGLAPKLDLKQSKMIVNMARSHRLVLEGKAAPEGQGSVTLSEDDFADLAELAIGNHCPGCQKPDWQNCRVYQVLSKCDVPPADTLMTSDCPYRQ